MKKKRPGNIALLNQLALQAAMQQQSEFDVTPPDLLSGKEVKNIPGANKKVSYLPIPQKHIKLTQSLLKILYNVYGGRKDLIRFADQWIKLVSLHTDEGDHLESQEYLDLLFFLFVFKETLQPSKKREHVVEGLSDLIYHFFGRKHLLKEIEKWTRFVARCTGKGRHTGSGEYLGLLNFFFVFKGCLHDKGQMSGFK